MDETEKTKAKQWIHRFEIWVTNQENEIKYIKELVIPEMKTMLKNKKA